MLTKLHEHNFTFICVVLFSFIFIQGCATIFDGSKEDISLSSEPKGAEVYLNGIKQGKAPMTLRLQKGNEYDIEFKMDGYDSKTWRLGYSLGAGWLILDILAGLVGIIVDAATGDWNGFDNNRYKAVLEKK